MIPKEDKMLDDVKAIMRANVEPYLSRAMSNLQRVIDLTNLANRLGESADAGQQKLSQDVLRSATVFLHAALEDFLRTVATALLPEAGQEVLDRIPLCTADENVRSEGKFKLGRLCAFRGKTVEQVLVDSVRQHLSRWSCSSTNDIAALLRDIGLRSEAVTHLLPTIGELIQRRHSIVHRADRQDCPDSGGDLDLLSSEEVINWLRVYTELFNCLNSLVLGPLLRQELCRAGRAEKQQGKYVLVRHPDSQTDEKQKRTSECS